MSVPETDDQHPWEDTEAQIALLREQKRALPGLIDVLEAVSGYQESTASRSDSDEVEEHVVTSAPEPWESEQPMFVTIKVMMTCLRRYFRQENEPSIHVSQRNRAFFRIYDSLVQALRGRKIALERSNQRRKHGAADSIWLGLFWRKWGILTQEVEDYRDSLNSASPSRISRYRMDAALFQLLVCLFLSREQIHKLRETVLDVDVSISLDNMVDFCEANNPADKDDHQYILSQLINDTIVPLLKIVVYMVCVDIVSVWSPEDFPADWRRIYYGDCLVLLQFAKTETESLDLQIHSLDEPWQTFLGGLKDVDGLTLNQCTICEKNIRDVVFMPCKCFGACRACAVEWRSRSETCPYCRTTIQSIDSVRQHLKEDGSKQLTTNQQAHLATRDIFGLLAELKRVAGR
jgi:hypothetical protein